MEHTPKEYEDLLNAVKLTEEAREAFRQAAFYQDRMDQSKDAGVRKEYREEYLNWASKSDELNDKAQEARLSALKSAGVSL